MVLVRFWVWFSCCQGFLGLVWSGRLVFLVFFSVDVNFTWKVCLSLVFPSFLLMLTLLGKSVFPLLSSVLLPFVHLPDCCTCISFVPWFIQVLSFPHFLAGSSV